MNLNEWKPTFYDSMSDVITLYHGTDGQAIDEILESGEINASKGRRHGETSGVNWFSLKPQDNFNQGVLFSIDVPKNDFEDGVFKFMNNSDVISESRSIDISRYNLQLVKVGGMGGDYFKRLYEKCGNDIFEMLEYLDSHNWVFEENYFLVDSPIFKKIVKQFIGNGALAEVGINESFIYEVEANDINLNSFNPKDELHHKFWINGKLNSRVREHLLDIADDFIDELAISNLKPIDIQFTGSLANYNWSRYSDIDVHIVVKFSDIYKNKEMLEDYFTTKRLLWNQTHENLKIYGYPVEISVEDADTPGFSTGVYSIKKNRWVKEPSNFDDAKINEKYVKDMAARLMTEIDEIEKKSKTTSGMIRLENVGKKAYDIFKRAKNLRKEGLARSGEFASGNIIWKILRRTGYLEKIFDIVNDTYVKAKSLK